MYSLFLIPGNFKHKSIPCDQINRFREWMGILVTAFLPFLPAALAHSTLRMALIKETVYFLVSGAISSLFSSDWPFLCVRLAALLGLLDFIRARGVVRLPFVSPHTLSKELVYVRITDCKIQSFNPLIWSACPFAWACIVTLPLHAPRGAYLMESGQTSQLVWPVKYGENNVVGLSRLDYKRPWNFCFYCLRMLLWYH